MALLGLHQGFVKALLRLCKGFIKAFSRLREKNMKLYEGFIEAMLSNLFCSGGRFTSVLGKGLLIKVRPNFLN